MRTIIAGSRKLTSYKLVCDVMAIAGTQGIHPSVILSGCADGVDRLGERWANERGVPLELYPAQWQKYGRSAGPVRNREMADKADALVAIWDGNSRGTKHMIDTARARGLDVFVWRAT